MQFDEDPQHRHQGVFRHSNGLHFDAAPGIAPYAVPRAGGLGLRSDSISSGSTDASSPDGHLGSGNQVTFHERNPYPALSFNPYPPQEYQEPGSGFYYPVQYSYPDFHAEVPRTTSDPYAYPTSYPSHANLFPRVHQSNQFSYPQAHSSAPFYGTLSVPSAQSTTTSNFESYRDSAIHPQILQPMPVPAQIHNQVRTLLDTNPTQSIENDLTPRANPHLNLPSTFPSNSTAHISSHIPIPPEQVVGSTRGKKVNPTNDGFASNLRKKFSSSSANLMRRVSDIKEKEADLSRSTNSRQGWPCKYEAEVFTPEE
jgi:hypothetical protein